MEMTYPVFESLTPDDRNMSNDYSTSTNRSYSKWRLFSRIMAAIFGGYLFTNVMSLLLFFLVVDLGFLTQQTDQPNIPVIHTLANGLATTGMVSFAIYTAAVMWVFRTPAVGRAWIGMLLPSIIGLGVIFLILPASIRGLLHG